MTYKEHGKQVLAPLIKELQAKLHSAKKMRKELDEASRQQKKERHDMRRKAAEEQWKREETRRLREQRLEAENEKKSDKSRRRDKSDGVVRDAPKEASEVGRRQEKSGSSKRDTSKERKPDQRKESSTHTDPGMSKESKDPDRSKRKANRDEDTAQKHSHLGKDKTTVSSRDTVEEPSLSKSQTPETKPGHNSTNKSVGEESIMGKDDPVDLGPQLASGYELHIAAFSAPKPRNLLSTFSQSSKMVDDAFLAVPSSQKKVRWQEDEDKQAVENDVTVSKPEERKPKKAFGGSSFARSSSSRSKAQSSKSSSSRSDRNAAATKSKKSTRENKDRTRKEPRAFGESRARKRYGTSDSLALVEDGHKKLSKTGTSRNPGKEPKRRPHDGDKSKSRSKRPANSKTEKVSSKRQHETTSNHAAEQKTHKRRRNVGPSKSTGAKSFGEDVGFGF